MAKRRGTGKAEVAPGVWELPPTPTARAIYSFVGVCYRWRPGERGQAIEVLPGWWMWHELWGYDLHDLAEQWNSGVRWVEPRTGN